MTEGQSPWRIPSGYRVLSRIGEGSFGTVYRAVQTSLAREVALKVHRSDTGPKAARRFDREARVLARLNHPLVLKVYDFGFCGNRGFLATELLEVGSLRQELGARGRLPLRRAVEHALELVDVLRYIHGHGVLHRDVKPENVLLARDGSIRLADFGLALVDGAPPLSSGTSVGTAHYMAPEIFYGQGYAVSTDLYAAGVMFYELLAGRVPTAGLPLRKLVHAKLTGALPRDDADASRVTPQLSAVLHRWLAPKAADRFASHEDLATALRAAVGSRPGWGRTRYRASVTVRSFEPPGTFRMPRAAGLAAALTTAAAALWGAAALIAR